MKKTQEIYMNPVCSLSVKTNKTMIIIVGYCYHTSCIWSSKTSLTFYNVTCNFFHSKSELYVWCICFITSLCVCVQQWQTISLWGFIVLFPCPVFKNALTLNRKREKHVLGFRSWYIIVSKFSGMKGSISRQYLEVEYRVL